MFIKDFTNIFRMADDAGAGGGTGTEGGTAGTGTEGGKSTSGSSQQGGNGDNGGKSTTGSGDKGGQSSGTEGGDKSGQTGDKGQSGDKGAAGTKTIVDDGGKSAPGDWPTDWRQKGIAAAGVPEADKAKVLGMLERLTSPGDLVKKVLEQDKLIAQGRHKVAFPKDGTDEQKNAWRKENGVPDAPDKYDLTLPDGLTVSETDKPIVSNILQAAHTANLTNGQIQAIMAAYYKSEGEFVTHREQEMADNKTLQEDALRKEWGEEYRDNVTIIGRLRDSHFSQETRNALAGALDSNGMPLLNNKAFLKDLALIARTINPVDTVPGGGAGNQMDNVNDRIKTIEDRMANDRDGYFKDEKMQKEYRDLLEWRDRNTKRA